MSLARTSFGLAALNLCRSGELQLGLSQSHVILKSPGWRAKAIAACLRQSSFLLDTTNIWRRGLALCNASPVYIRQDVRPCHAAVCCAGADSSTRDVVLAAAFRRA